MDRDNYPQGAQVHATIGDHRLNIDPTRADVWTWNMTSGDKYYGAAAVTNEADGTNTPAARRSNNSPVHRPVRYVQIVALTSILVDKAQLQSLRLQKLTTENFHIQQLLNRLKALVAAVVDDTETT